MNDKRDPYLYFKYNQGLGDFVASVLHSKALGWLTKLITGKDKPCKICSKRAEALNILFPIPFWKLFFKSRQAMIEALNTDLQAAGHTTFLSEDKTKIASTKSEFVQNFDKSSVNPFNNFFNEEKLSKYTFLYSSDHEVDHLLIRTQYFKLNN